MSSFTSIFIHEIVHDLDVLEYALGIPVYIVH